VGDDHRATRELEERVLEAAEGFDVQVVGRFVEQQQVAALLEGEREVQPGGLDGALGCPYLSRVCTPRQFADFLFVSVELRFKIGREHV
jgi:hypothetical protein